MQNNLGEKNKTHDGRLPQGWNPSEFGNNFDDKDIKNN